MKKGFVAGVLVSMAVSVIVLFCVYVASLRPEHVITVINETHKVETYRLLDARAVGKVLEVVLNALIAIVGLDLLIAAFGYAFDED